MTDKPRQTFTSCKDVALQSADFLDACTDWDEAFVIFNRLEAELAGIRCTDCDQPIVLKLWYVMGAMMAARDLMGDTPQKVAAHMRKKLECVPNNPQSKRYLNPPSIPGGKPFVQ